MLFSRRLTRELMANQQRALAIADELVALVENAADPTDPALEAEKLRLAGALEQETKTTVNLTAALRRARRLDMAVMYLAFAGMVLLVALRIWLAWRQAHPG